MALLHAKTLLALAAGLAAFLVTAGCDAARTTPTDRGLKTGHFDLSPEVRRLLPRGAVLYYSKSTFLRRTIRGTEFRWAVERLDIDSGNTQELISTDSSGLIELLPYSVSPDNRHLLLTARTRDRKKLLLELDLNTLQWRTITTDVGMSVYSPDGKLIATYSITYPPGERRNPILRTRIITRDGKLVKELPCKSNRCSHMAWGPYNNSIIYIDNDSEIVLYSMSQRSLTTLYSAREGHRVHDPISCAHDVYAIEVPLDRRKKSDSALIHIRIDKEKISRKSHEFPNKFSAACTPIKNTFVVVDRGELNEYMWLGTYNVVTNELHRITPGPSARLAFSNPIVAVSTSFSHKD